jgi:flavin reductase (DIM6/NTAB) family NADH-FMN oxidoreductase RutF
MKLQTHSAETFVTHHLRESNLPYAFLNSIIVPRPVALITTLGEKGIVNAAPFSYFNAVCKDPVILSVSISKREKIQKDTARNILTNQEFVVNICSFLHAQAVSITGIDFPPDVSEIDMAKLSLISSQHVKVPRISDTLIQIECKLYKHFDMEDLEVDLILGEAIAVHIHNEIFNPEGLIDIAKLNPLARLSGKAYAKLHEFFEF